MSAGEDLLTQAEDAYLVGDVDSAIQCCKDALIENEEDEDSYRFLCNILLRTGKFDEALDTGCDWGSNCGNNEAQLRVVVDAAYLSGSRSMLKAAAEKMCTCIVSDLCFVHTLALCADMRVKFGGGDGSGDGSGDGTEDDSDDVDSGLLVSEPLNAWVETGDDSAFRRTLSGPTGSRVSIPVTGDDDDGDDDDAVTGGKVDEGDGEGGLGSYVVDEDERDPQVLERQMAYAAYIAAIRKPSNPVPLQRLMSLYESCSVVNVTFVLALLVPLLLAANRRADAAELVARAVEGSGVDEKGTGGPSGRGKGRGAEMDTNWCCCDALVSPVPLTNTAALVEASSGATPLIRKRVLAHLAAIGSSGGGGGDSSEKS